MQNPRPATSDRDGIAEHFEIVDLKPLEVPIYRDQTDLLPSETLHLDDPQDRDPAQTDSCHTPGESSMLPNLPSFGLVPRHRRKGTEDGAHDGPKLEWGRRSERSMQRHVMVLGIHSTASRLVCC